MEPYVASVYRREAVAVETTMMPPIIRRCPGCGHTNWSGRFALVVADDGRRLVECPACDHRFEPVDRPMLN